MYTALYTEVNLLSAFILAYIFVKERRSVDQRMEVLMFNRIVVLTFSVLIVDALWSLCFPVTSELAYIVGIITSCLYLFQTGVISYFWLAFTEFKLTDNKAMPKGRFIACMIPLAILFVLCAASPWTGWMCYIDDAGNYVRGPLHFVQVFIGYGFFVISAIRLLRVRRHTISVVQREELSAYLSFFILPGIFGIANALVEGIPMLWPATAVSLMMLYVKLQGYQISTDGLTGMNNRRRFDRYLQMILGSHETPDRSFYLLLMDVDGFKQINDKHGHVEGDTALCTLSGMLKKLCGSQPDAFLARYGGDEFAVILGVSDEAEVRRFAEEVRIGCDRLNTSPDRPYRLSLSVGYAKCPTDSPSASSDVLRRADAMMYKQKALL